MKLFVGKGIFSFEDLMAALTKEEVLRLKSSSFSIGLSEAKVPKLGHLCMHVAFSEGCGMEKLVLVVCLILGVFDGIALKVAFSSMAE